MPNLFSRIAIGCANWDKPYNGSRLSDKNITKVLGYCQTSGIDTLDMATAYGNDFDRPNSYFNKIIKVQSVDEVAEVLEIEPYAIMAHNMKVFGEVGLDSVSVYSPEDLLEIGENDTLRIVQLPYSLYDRRFESDFEQLKEDDVEIHVRSIFLRGRILKDGIEPCECIKFCLCNPYIDKVIIGVDSFEQLQRNLDFLHRWKNLERHDEELLDTRRW
ncbi:hypothetical protein LCGC14_0730440 [marine sediment metagenome]|uniref:NADP-dependent oxidoreductase domain-containing protein n=1 Tax=marine sediment metagenome TaxID=412755 RepID=A0A0F9SUX7_9ZZZZ